MLMMMTMYSTTDFSKFITDQIIFLNQAYNIIILISRLSRL